ncbi:MAG: RNA repair transcriptional activator RtcR family protein [Candidatus Methylophosphatis roskildensis]
MVAHRVQRDIESVSPETAERLVEMELRDPSDFDEVYTALHDFARGYAFDTEREDYVIHITTGTHVAQIGWVLLTETRTLPARLLQTAPPRKKAVGDSIGGYEIIDLDLTRYDRIAQRFKREQADTMSFLTSGIATRNARVNRVIERIEQVAVRSTAPVLLVDPTGAG